MICFGVDSFGISSILQYSILEYLLCSWCYYSLKIDTLLYTIEYGKEYSSEGQVFKCIPGRTVANYKPY